MHVICIEIYSSEEVKSICLTLTEWGNGIYGAEAAARSLFSCPAAALTLSQAIRLASVLPNPRRFYASGNGNQRMNRKRKIIAGRMLRRHWIQPEQYAATLKEMELEN